MANALGTLSGSLIIQEALRLAFTERPEAAIISLNTRELDGKVENALLNQAVITRTKTVSTVGNFGDNPADVTDADVSISLTAHKQVYHQLTAAQINSTDRDLIREQAEPMAKALWAHVIDAIAAKWLNANFTNKLIVASGWDYDTVVDLMTDLDSRGVPADGRFFAFNGAVNGSLLKDPMIVAYLNNPANAEAIRTGRLPEVQGFNMAKYIGLPANGENLVGVVGTPESVLVATRAPKDPTELGINLSFPGNIGYVEDPNTGFKVLVTQWVDPVSLNVNNRISWLEGFAIGDASKLTRLVTA